MKNKTIGIQMKNNHENSACVKPAANEKNKKYLGLDLSTQQVGCTDLPIRHNVINEILTTDLSQLYDD